MQTLLSHPLSALAHFTGIGRSRDASGALSQYRATHLGEDEPGEVDAVNGAFMFCRAEAIQEVGLLDEGYWLYKEDLDWCHRFWDAGWKIFYEPGGPHSTLRAAPAGHDAASVKRSPSTAEWPVFTVALTHLTTTLFSTPQSTLA